LLGKIGAPVVLDVELRQLSSKLDSFLSKVERAL